VTDVPHLRPLGIGEILDVALKIVWRNAGTLLRAVVFVVLPVQVVSTLITVSASPSGGNGFGSSSGRVNGNDVAAAVVGVGAAAILGFVGSTLASGACYRLIASAYLGRRTGWVDSLRYALRRLPSIIGVTLLAGLAAAIGVVLCVIPGIYLWVSFSLAIPVLLTERCGVGRSLGRSRELVGGFWWRVFAVSLLGYILSSVLGGAIEGVVAAVSTVNTTSDTVVGVVLAIVAGTLSKLVTTPFVAAFVTVLYFDLRVRKEAFDLQLLAEGIGVDPGEVAASPAAQAPPAAGEEQPPFWPPPPGWKPGGGSSP
jgi:hypothetical protein